MTATERAVVLSLPGSDRRRTLEHRLEPAGLPVEVVDACNGYRERPFDWGLSRGAWGCRMSHLELLRAAEADKLESYLVLEDDVQLAANVRWQDVMSSAPADWQVIMLGGHHWRMPTDVGNGMVRCHRTVLTHAMLIRRSAYAPLINAIELYRWHVDHAIAWAMDDVKVYAPKRWIAWQDGSPSSIDMTGSGSSSAAPDFIPAGPFPPPNRVTGIPGPKRTTFSELGV